MTTELTSTSTQETFGIGKWLGSQLPPSAIVGLNGPLGAGKTWLAKGIVDGLGDFDTTLVKSPAYNLIHEYPLQNPARTVFHIDFFRLKEMRPQDAVSFSEVLKTPGTIKLVEWASPHLEMLVMDLLTVSLALGRNTNSRTIRLDAHSSLYRDIVLACRDIYPR